MGSIIIYPGEVIRKAQKRNQQLEKMKEAVSKEKKVFNNIMFHEGMLLQGMAWQSAKNYINNIQIPLLNSTNTWLEYQMEANRKYESAGEALPSVECLNQAKLEANKAYWESCLADEREEEEPDYSYIALCKSNIKTIKSLLDAIDSFERKTAGIFDAAHNMLSILQRADTEIAKVSYDASANMLNLTGVDKAWLLSMGDLFAIERLKADGLSDEQIKEAQEYGFSGKEIYAIWEEMKNMDITDKDIGRLQGIGYNVGDILKMWDSLPGESDKEVISYLINREYVEAFQIDPSTLGGNTFDFIYGYSCQLAAHDQLKELTEMINGMLYTDKDHSKYALSPGLAYGEEYMNEIVQRSNALFKLLEEDYVNNYNTYTKDERTVIGEELFAQTKMNALWNTVSLASYDRAFYEEAGAEIDDLWYGSKIENLKETNFGFTFDCVYQGVILDPFGEQYHLGGGGAFDGYLVWREDDKLPVQCNIVYQMESIVIQRYMEKHISLEKEIEGLKDEYISKSASGLFAMAFPRTSTVLSLVSGTDNSTLSTAKNTVKLVEQTEILKGENKKNFKTGTGILFNTVGVWSDYQKKLGSMKDKDALLDLEEKINWFGAASTYQAGELTGTVNMGFYDLSEMDRLMEWQNGGISSVLDNGEIRDEDLETLIVKLKKELKDQGVYKEDNEGNRTAVTILMDGGDILGMDEEDLDEAAKIIENTYNNSIDSSYKKGYLKNNKSISILNIFHSPIAGNEE